MDLEAYDRTMNNSLLLLNHSSPIPSYEQISLQIRALIASAQLLPGDFLPSVRQLARDLGIAPNTVVRAYNELERDGWVVTAARRGVAVAAHLPVVTPQERQHQLQEAITQLLIKAHQLGLSAEELHAEIDRQIYPNLAGGFNQLR